MKRLRAFRPTRKLSILLMGGLSSLLLAGTAVFALGGFTATITNNSNSYASGTIVLQENQASNTCLSSAAGAITTNSAPCATINLFGATNAVPGTSNNVVVTFKNIGSVNASTFTLTPAACTAAANPATAPYYGSDTNGFCGLVDVTIQNNTVPGSPACVYPAGPGACPALSNTDTLATLAAAGPLSLGAVAAGATDSFTISAELDPTATNADQGLAASENLAWELSQ